MIFFGGSGEGMRLLVSVRPRVAVAVLGERDGMREMGATSGALWLVGWVGWVGMLHCTSALPSMGVSTSLSWAAGEKKVRSRWPTEGDTLARLAARLLLVVYL